MDSFLWYLDPDERKSLGTPLKTTEPIHDSECLCDDCIEDRYLEEK